MALVLWLIYFVILVCSLIYFAFSRPPNFPPGPPRLPFWGSYWFLLWGDYKFPHMTMHRLAKKYKTDVLGFYLGTYPTVVTYTHELCKELLTRPEFQGRMDSFVLKLRGLGKLLGIFFVEGPFWQEQRRFALRHMRDFGFGRRSHVLEGAVAEEIEEVINILRNGVQRPEDKDISSRKGCVVVPDVFYAGLANSIWLVMAGDRFPKNSYKKLRVMAKAALGFQRVSDPTGGALGMTPWLRFLAPNSSGYKPVVAYNKVLLDFMTEAIEQHKESFSEDVERDFIDMYLKEMRKLKETEDYSSFSDEQLLLTTVDFLFPPPSAISIVMTFLLRRLLFNPHVQEKVQEEIDRVVGRDRYPTLDDRPMMPYIEATMREGMRTDPLNPLGLARKCIEDTTLGGYFIPKGTMMFPSIYTINRDPDLWEEPELFKPERWLDEEGKLLKKDNTMPFGAGKRLCAGETFARQNMFLFFSALMQNFTFKVPDGQPPPDVNGYVPGFLVSPVEFEIEAVPRD